jgi:hypothetical protein
MWGMSHNSGSGISRELDPHLGIIWNENENLSFVALKEHEVTPDRKQKLKFFFCFFVVTVPCCSEVYSSVVLQ